MSTSDAHFVRLVAVTILATTLAGCPFLDDDPDADDSSDRQTPDTAPGDDTDGSSEDDPTVCGMETLPSPSELPADPCESGDRQLDATFERDAGAPDVSTETLTLDEASSVCLTVHNGAGAGDGPGRGGRGGTDRLSAAWISVDGEQIFGPDAFDQETERLRETIDLEAGSHDLRVRLASSPGASLQIVARSASRGDAQPTAGGDQGLLEARAIAVDHPLFSPNGDDFHDTALFNAENLPEKPADDTYSYTIRWDWQITRVDTCDRVDADLSGETPVNSPTTVRASWDGRTQEGSVVPNGQYLYQYHAELVRSDDRVVDELTSRARGMIVDASPPDFTTPTFDDRCDPSSDPNDCQCPSSTGEQTRCTFAWIPDLEDFEDPSAVDRSAFLTRNRDSETGRWEVVVDLREFNGGGLVPQGDGTWESLDALQRYVSELTGVPPDDSETRLFNFDYTQLGYSTPVVPKEGSIPGFNHFLLDVITDASGSITIDGRTIDLKDALRRKTDDLPASLEVRDPRTERRCTYNGNTDGDSSLRASACTEFRNANLDPGGTDLGIYLIRKRLFDLRVDGRGTTRDSHCVLNGIFKCGVRTLQRNASPELLGTEYVQDDQIRQLRSRRFQTSGVPSVVSHTDRFFSPDGGRSSIIDGVCSEDGAAIGPLAIPLDSGVGSLPSVCVLNGIF